jgi:hypothetical protein
MVLISSIPTIVSGGGGTT